MKVQSKIYCVTTALALLAMAVVITTVGTNFKVAWFPTIVFGSFFIISVLRFVDVSVGDTVIQVDSDTAFVIGASVIFVTLNSPLGFFLAYITTAFYLPNIKKHEWEKLIFNSANVMLGGFCCFLTLRLADLKITDSLILYSGKILLAGTAFVLINYLFLAIIMVISNVDWREALYPLKTSLTEVIPLAVFSGLLGKFYFDYGSMMLLLFAAPLFLGHELLASFVRMQDTQKQTLETLTRTLEAKDKYTAGHVERVAKFAKYIGQELGYGPKRLERLRQAALLHDAGKLIVPSALLNKPGKLTEEEFKIIQRHEFVTIEILKMIDFLAPIAHVAGGDHNKMEGHSTRKLEPFIVSACDAFDAMTSSRSYRKALPMEVAFEELHSKQGKQFHPKVVEALINAIESRDEHYGDGYETDIVHADAPEAGIGSAGIGDLEDEGDPSASLGMTEDTPLGMTDDKSSEMTESHSIPSVLRSSVASDAIVTEIVVETADAHESQSSDTPDAQAG